MAFWAAFWISLAFTVAGELLRPKQKPSDVKPASIDDFSAPTVSETRNWPWFAGTCYIEGPNLTWYGDLRTEAIKKKVKTGWFSSTNVTVNNKYFLGLELFLGIGGDAGIDDIVGVRFGGKAPDPSKYTKTTTADEIVFEFNDPDFFGGNEDGGGVVGSIRIAKGTSSQNANAYMQTVLGRTRSAYRGLCFAVCEAFYLGTRPSIPKIGFVAQRFPNTLGVLDGKYRIGDDANPACLIYEYLTDLRWGGQIPSIRVDGDNFRAIAARLHAEGYGLSMLVNSARSAKDQIDEILRHIDGVLYTDPETGLLSLALARDDYDVANLPVYDEDSITTFNFSRGSWSETSNTLLVSYVDREEDFTPRTLPLRDSANIAARGGMIAAEQLDFLGFSSAEPATKRGHVALKALSYPLLSGKIQTNSRRARKLRPGSVIKVNWPIEGIEGLVLRITRINYGDPMGGAIELECLEDIFALTGVDYVVPPPTKWVDPVTAPQPLVAQYAFEAPYHMIGAEARVIATLGSRFSGIDSGYETWQDIDGGTSYAQTGKVTEFTPTGVLSAGYPSTTGAVDAIGFSMSSMRDAGVLRDATQNELVAGESLAMIVSDAGQEIIAWKNITDNGDGTFVLFNVMRGVFDTIPLDHGAGSRVWFLSYGMGALDSTPYASAGVVTGKLLPYNVRGVLALSDAAQLTVQVGTRAWAPYPAADLAVNGVANGYEVSGDAVLTWAIRHRTLQAQMGVVVAQDAANVTDTPEGRYEVKVYIGGAARRTVQVAASPFDTFTYTPDMRRSDYFDETANMHFGVRAVNGSYRSVERLTHEFLMLDALDPLEVTTATLPAGTAGTAYSVQLQAAGGKEPYTWSATSGLPPEFTVSATGEMSAEAPVAGTSSVTIQVEGPVGVTASKTLTLQVN